MVGYLVPVDFTDEGIRNIANAAQRPEVFEAAPESAGARVEAQYVTLGAHDGAFVLSAPDDAITTSLVLGLGKAHNLKTTMLRACRRGRVPETHRQDSGPGLASRHAVQRHVA